MAKTKRDSSLSAYAVAAVVLIIVVFLLFLNWDKLFPGEKTPVPPIIVPPATEPTQPPEGTTPGGPELASAKESKSCSIGSAIGYRGRTDLDNGDVEAIIFNPIEPRLEGLRYRFFDVSGKTLPVELNINVGEATKITAVDGGEEDGFIIPFSQYPDAVKAEMIPITRIDGELTLCINQHLVLIK